MDKNIKRWRLSWYKFRAVNYGLLLRTRRSVRTIIGGALRPYQATKWIFCDQDAELISFRHKKHRFACLYSVPKELDYGAPSFGLWNRLTNSGNKNFVCNTWYVLPTCQTRENWRGHCCQMLVKASQMPRKIKQITSIETQILNKKVYGCLNFFTLLQSGIYARQLAISEL